MLYMWIARALVTKYLYPQVNSLILLFVVTFLENVLCAGFRSQISNDVLKQQTHLFLLIFLKHVATVSNVSFCEYNLSIHA